MIAIDKTPVSIVPGGDPLDLIWWRGKQWAVTKYGLERLDGSYHIEASELVMRNLGDCCWVGHVGHENGIDTEEFTTAFIMGVFLHESEWRREAILQAHENNKPWADPRSFDEITQECERV